MWYSLDVEKCKYFKYIVDSVYINGLLAQVSETPSKAVRISD